jgi:fucose permease
MVSALILLFILTHRQWTRPSRPAQLDGNKTQRDATPKRLRAILISGVMMFMIYTGLEVTAGSWGFTWLSEGRGIPPATAALWISLYWGALTVGRLFFGFLGGRWHAKCIIASMMAAVILGALLFLQPWSAWGNLIAMPIIGFACAPIFPLLVSYTPTITGPKAAADIIGKQVAAASVGSALVPLIIGLGVELFNLSAIPGALLGSILLLVVFYRIWIGFEKRG